MESYKNTTVLIDQERNEDVGGRKFEEKIEEFEFNLLKDFRSALKNIDNLICPMNDSFLLRFLRTKKHNVGEAVKVVRKYFGLRKRHPDMLLLPFATIEKVLATKLITILKNRDHNGSMIAYIKVVQWNTKEFTLNEVMMAGYYLLEEITTMKEVQKAGIVAIFDCTGLTVSHSAEIAKELSIKQFRKLVSFYQGAFPAKIKKVIAINLPMILTAVYAVGKYLIKYKLRNRIHLSSLGPKIIHDHISPNSLPVDLGGPLNNEQAIDGTFAGSVINNEPYYRAIEKCGYST